MKKIWPRPESSAYRPLTPPRAAQKTTSAFLPSSHSPPLSSSGPAWPATPTHPPHLPSRPLQGYHVTESTRGGSRVRLRSGLSLVVHVVLVVVVEGGQADDGRIGGPHRTQVRLAGGGGRAWRACRECANILVVMHTPAVDSQQRRRTAWAPGRVITRLRCMGVVAPRNRACVWRMCASTMAFASYGSMPA
jgi:hypothetical protein